MSDGSVQQCDALEIFSRTCGGTGCHSESNPAAGLDLLSPGVEARVVGVDGVDCFGVYANPARPEQSLLYTKVDENPTCGNRMPLGGTPLSLEEITCIRDWISGLTPVVPDASRPDASADAAFDASVPDAASTSECTVGQKQSCFGGPSSFAGVSHCKAGTQTCLDTERWGPCTDQSLPQVELCLTPVDENCDGETPECGAAWSLGIGGPRNQSVEGVAADSEGNIVIMGSFEDAWDFGGGPLVSPGVGDSNENNVFLAKYDSVGTPIWSKQFGDTSNQLGSGIALDPRNDDIVILIRARGTTDLGGEPLTVRGDSDVIVARFTKDGTHRWSRVFGGSMLDRAERVAVDPSGHVLIGGKFTGELPIVGLSNLAAEGITDGFVIKLDESTGETAWALRIGGSGDDDYVFGLEADANGDVYVTGRFDGTLELGTTTLASAGSRDIFVAKLTADGAYDWATAIGAEQDDRAYDLVVDRANARVYLAGHISGTVKFGSDDVSSSGDRDLFVAALSTDGSALWAKAYGDDADQLGSDLDFATTKWLALALAPGGDLVIAGPLWGSAEFDASSPGGLGLLRAAGDGTKSDIFFARLSADGAFVTGGVFGRTGSELVQDVAITPTDDVAIAGRFAGSSVSFGPSGTVFGDTGDFEGFVAVLER